VGRLTGLQPAWRPPDRATPWERRLERVFQVAPYLLLGGATLLSLLQVEQSWGHRLVTVGLAVLAGLWVTLMFTLRSNRWRANTGAMLLYFAGLLTFAWVLQARSFFFVAFTIVGFLQPFLVLPPLFGFLVIGASSVVIYTASGGFPEPTVAAWSGYVFIIVLQTAITGFFSFVGVRVNEEQRQRQRLLDELERAQEENAGLHVQLLTQAREAGVLDERQRMASEIHDTLAQGLTGIITQLEAADRLRERPELLQGHIERARALARDSLTEARRSVQALRPEPLDASRLPEAIAEMGQRWSEASGVTLSFETTGEPRPILAELEATLFRVAQEALANVAKHADACKVGLTLSYMEDAVLLDVRDDGAGFEPGSARSRASGGFGLGGMRQRLRRVAGNLEIESAPGEGTAVNASVPAIAVEGGG
jgi:signal transduction histidine kinase